MFCHCYCHYYAHNYCSIVHMGHKMHNGRLLASAPKAVCVPAFASWSQRYCLTVTGIWLMYFMFHMITLPVFITCTQYDHPWWSLLLPSMMVPCVQRLPISIWTTNVEPEENNVESLQVSLFLMHASCLQFRAS